MTGEADELRSDSRCRVSLALCGALALNLPNFVYPYFEDTALFAAFGRWMHEGRLPYRDLIDQKPPGIYWLSYVTYSLFGTSALGARMVELVAIIALALGCGRIVARVLPAAHSWSILVAAAFCSGSFWRLPERGQVEFFEAAAMTWSVALALDYLDRRRSREAFLSGLGLGLATWFKPQAILVTLPILLTWVAGPLSSRPFRSATRGTLLLAAGGAAASTPFLAWLAWTRALAPFLELYQYVQQGYLALAPVPTFARVIGDLRLPTTPPATAILVLVFVTLGLVRVAGGGPTDRQRSARFVLLGGWLIAGFAQFLSGRFLFHYHKIIMIPALAVLAAVGSWWLVSSLFARMGQRATALRRIAMPGALVLTFLLFAMTPKILDDAVALVHWSVAEEADPLWCRYGRYSYYYDYCAQATAAEHVRIHSRPQDHTQVIALAGAYYLHSGLLPATRYPIAAVALDPRAPGHSLRLEEFLGDLLRNRPVFIIVRTTDYFPWFGAPPGAAIVRQEPSLERLLTEEYRFEGEISPGLLSYRFDPSEPRTSISQPLVAPQQGPQ